MTFLIIGNGFDKAIGLPTGYPDFLNFILYLKKYVFNGDIKSSENIDTFYIDERIKEILYKQIVDSSSLLNINRHDISLICNDNFWVKLFLHKQSLMLQQGKNRWVDFETEITLLINKIEREIDKIGGDIDSKYNTYDLEENDMFSNDSGREFETFRDIHDKLLIDLNNITWLLGFYFSSFVEKIEVNGIPQVLKNIIENENTVPRIISFNYTHFLEKYISGMGKNVSVDYIHGECFENSEFGLTNMVLGSASGRDLVDFADFKKYFQRILKNTDHSYLDWFETLDASYEKNLKNNINIEKLPKNFVYFFGHSIDITDGEIIQRIIRTENTITTIYCYAENPQDHKDIIQKIKNMQVIIGRDELNKRTGIYGSLKFCVL